MNQEARRLVDRLWNYCNVLRDDGVSASSYLACVFHLPRCPDLEREHESAF